MLIGRRGKLRLHLGLVRTLRRDTNKQLSQHDVVVFSLFCFPVCEELGEKRHLDTIRSMEYWLGELKESLL